MFELGPFRLDLIDDGRFELQGDAFTRLGGHGHSGRVAPRVMIGFNTLLIRGRGRTILVDPGTGDKRLADSYRRYHLELPRKVFGALEQLGVGLQDVDTVILTHLHWDHVGAATSVSDAGDVVPTFPKARYVLQHRELAAARAAIVDGDDGYISADFEPLVDAGVLDLLDTDAEIAPGVSVRWVGGHSPGLQIVHVDGGDSGRAVYLSDLIPTNAQLPLHSVSTYDLNHPELLDSKQRVLDEAVGAHDLLLFVHAPRSRAGYVSRDARGAVHLERLQI
ncbi:MBL fold metallo-hydrolase [candidate division KSB1 bacterium]|nr:MBL fold metallo-hydrolase [candidate division KSB1 bacterium]